MTRTEDDLRAALTPSTDPTVLARLNEFVDELARTGSPPARTGRRRTPGRRNWAPVAAVLAVLVVIAGGLSMRGPTSDHREPAAAPGTSASAEATSRPPHPGRPHYLGRLSAPTVRADGSLRLDPPAAGQSPALTAEAAYRAWCADQPTACARSAGPDVVLAVVTTPNSGPVGPTGAVTRPRVDHVLGYVLTWAGIECPPHQPVVRSDDASAVAPPRNLSCTRTAVAAAATGAPIAGVYYTS